jgi:GTP pyrophosphokinase/guanosine-3',5'-bis(diphosphate) 3'-pyrophosphohydrolase
MDNFFNEIKDIRDIKTATKKLFSLIGKTDKLQEALDFTIESHKEQFRKSGEPYVVHPILVATIAAQISNDMEMLISALLHDVVEDTEHTVANISDRFGKNVAHIVNGLTKITKIKDEVLEGLDSKNIKTALSLRKMLTKSTTDIRIIVVKLCDRVHNMLTLDAMSEEKQKRISQETLTVYTPMAHRLGISILKNVLEDLSFRYLYSQDYKKLDDFILSVEQNLQLQLNNFISRLKVLLIENGIEENDFQIISRVKHYYSIYMKMQRKGISIDEVLDILAVRVLLKNQLDCYKVLGLIHLEYKPLISRLKDYIALPKENGYQTLHSSVFDGVNIYEVQIRTFDMHKSAEYGVAAHWKYKSGDVKKTNTDWFHNLEYKNNKLKEFYEYTTNDLYSETIEVYSPKNEAYSLPRGAKAIDFAYAIHSDIGNKAIGCIIDEEKKSLLTSLRNGDHVRIITSNEEQLHCSWQNIVKTSRARNHITENCKKRKSKLDKEIAINILCTIFGKSRYKILEILEKEDLSNSIVTAASNIEVMSMLTNKIKKVLAQEVNILLRPKYTRVKLKNYQFDNIIIHSFMKISEVVFDHCCHPKFGDDVVAFLSKGKAQVHHKFCSNASKMIENSKPMLYICWDNNKPVYYTLIISLENKKGSLATFLNYLAKLDINVLSIKLGNSTEKNYQERCHLDIASQEKDKKILEIEISKKYSVLELTYKKDAYTE